MAVGLAMTVGVERLVPVEGRGDVRLSVGLVFFGFIATLVPSYHGAQRHLDMNHLVPGRSLQHSQALFFGDFTFLFVEACVLIAMGAVVQRPVLFLVAWCLLLLLDVLWLAVFVLTSGVVQPTDENSRWHWL